MILDSGFFVHQLLQRRSQRPLRFLRGARAFHGIENPPVFYNLHHYIKGKPACQYDSAAPTVGQFQTFVQKLDKAGRIVYFLRKSVALEWTQTILGEAGT